MVAAIEHTENFNINIKCICKSVTISWPIIKETEKAILVETIGGEIWLPRYLFDKHDYTAFEAQKLLSNFKEISANYVEDLIPVKKAGKGPTEKSHKIKFDVFCSVYDVDKFFLGHKKRSITKTIPVSQLVEKDGNTYAPSWILKQKLEKGEMLSVTTWKGLPKVLEQITNIINEIDELTKEHYRLERQRVREKLEAREKRDIKGTNAIQDINGGRP